MNSGLHYVYYDRRVSAPFRELILERYPALREGGDAELYRRMLQTLLFSTFLDEATGWTVLSHEVLAALAGKNPHNGGFRSEDLLDRFSREVAPLQFTPACYREGRARTVELQLDDPLREAVAAELERARHRVDADLVWFTSGDRCSRRSVGQWQKEREQEAKRAIAAIPTDHPATKLLRFLNRQPPQTLRKILNKNWANLNAAVEALPRATAQAQRQAGYCDRVVAALAEDQRHRYRSVPHSPRLFAYGASVNQLPRKLRKIALAGTTGLDLRAAQLAIVARLWEVGPLQDFLQSGESFWTHMLGTLKLDEANKPILKRVIYAITFGMGRTAYHRLLSEGHRSPAGDVLESGIEKKRARSFFAHRLVKALLKGRGEEAKRIRRHGGAEDAFGSWIAIRETGAPAVMAAVCQSYELRLMLAALPHFQEGGVSIVSWLHDGVALHFRYPSKKPAQIRRIKQAVKQAAKKMSMHTEFEGENEAKERARPQERNTLGSIGSRKAA